MSIMSHDVPHFVVMLGCINHMMVKCPHQLSPLMSIGSSQIAYGVAVGARQTSHTTTVGGSASVRWLNPHDVVNIEISK